MSEEKEIPKDGDHNIAGKKINNETMFQLNFNLKTLIVIVGFIISTVTGAWFDLKVRIDNSSESAKTEISKFESDIKEIKFGIGQLKDIDVRSVSDRINLVDGKVQGLIVILQSRSHAQPTHVQPTTNHVPTYVQPTNTTVTVQPPVTDSVSNNPQ